MNQSGSESTTVCLLLLCTRVTLYYGLYLVFLHDTRKNPQFGLLVIKYKLAKLDIGQVYVLWSNGASDTDKI